MKYVRVTFSLWGVECRLIFAPFVGAWAAIWLRVLAEVAVLALVLVALLAATVVVWAAR